MKYGLDAPKVTLKNKTKYKYGLDVLGMDNRGMDRRWETHDGQNFRTKETES